MNDYTTARLPLPLVTQDRTCGPCTACCTTHAVYEIRKPAGQQCRHTCDQGCAIYADRPESCRTFECLWLMGRVIEGDERRRPDRLGLVFGVGVSGRKARIIQCHEVWASAADSGTPGRYYLDKLSREFAVQLVRTDHSAFILPTWEPIEFTREDENWDTPLWSQWLDRLKDCGLVGPE